MRKPRSLGNLCMVSKERRRVFLVSMEVEAEAVVAVLVFCDVLTHLKRAVCLVNSVPVPW